MFITDFDGTLLRSDYTLCQKDVNEILNLKKQGVIIVVATGRSAYSFDFAMSKLKINKPCLDYLIFSTGAGILSYPHKKIIRSKSLENNSVKEIMKILDKGEIDYMVHKPIPYTRDFMYRLYNKNNLDFLTRLNLYKDYCYEIEDNFDFSDATQIIAIIPHNKKQEQSDYILKNIKGYNLIKATSPLDHKSLWIEIFPKIVCKSLAASWLARKLNIDTKDILAVGNDYNDEDLLDWSGTSFIAENAPKDLKQKYTQVPSNDFGAVKTSIKMWKSAHNKMS